MKNNIFSYLKIYKKWFILGPAIKLIEAIIEIFIPLLIAEIIDYIFLPSDTISLNNFSFIFEKFIFMFILLILGYITAIIAQAIASKVSQKFSFDLRNSLLNRISTFSVLEVDNFTSSSLSNRLINDVNTLELGVAMFIRQLIRVPFICIGSLVMIFFINKLSFCILSVFMIILLFIMYFIIIKSSHYHSQSNSTLDSLLLKVKENLSNIRLIKAFVSKDKEKNKFKYTNKKLNEFSQKANFLSNLLTPISTIILDVTILLIIYFGNIQYNNSILTEGKLIAIINYITQMVTATLMLTNLIVLYTKCFSSAKRINEILELNTSNKKNTTLNKFDKKQENAIELKNVSFSYNNSNNLFNNFNFIIKQNQIVGLIGLTGSGKTTLLNLINNTISTSSGELKIYGNNINSYDTNFLKDSIIEVTQTPEFFETSIYENISLGKEISKDTLNYALESSCSLEFVSKIPNKEFFKLESGGENLSGGQKQRLNIARAFARKPDFLLLDDITSSVDLKTESIILKNIQNFVKNNNITTIITSQKTSSLSICDLIIVLENGKIENIGNHEYLLEHSKLYKKIYNIQKKEI